MGRILGKSLKVLICAALTVQLMGCGTLMYPERKGQKAGRIDAGVALLDGLGLLFFLIPGVIAFAVDFNNGTIYLPGTSASSSQMKDIKQVKFDPKHKNLAEIEAIIKEQTGRLVRLDQSNVMITKLSSTDEMIVQFAQVLPDLQDNLIVSNR